MTTRIKSVSCVQVDGHPSDLMGGDFRVSRFIEKPAYRATLVLLMDDEGLDRLRAILRQEFGATEDQARASIEQAPRQPGEGSRRR